MPSTQLHREQYFLHHHFNEPVRSKIVSRLNKLRPREPATSFFLNKNEKANYPSRERVRGVTYIFGLPTNFYRTETRITTLVSRTESVSSEKNQKENTSNQFVERGHDV